MNRNDIEQNKLNYITLKLTNRCNLNCIMCGQVYSEFREQKEDLDYNIIKQRLEACEDISTVYLFGGEPLLYKEFVPLIKLLNEKSVDTLISTNGTLLEQYIDDLIKYRVRDVSISIDSFEEEICNRIRGKGVFSKVINNIGKLIEAKKKAKSQYPYIGINCVILDGNYKKLVDYYNWFESNYPEICRINFESPIAMTKELGACHEKVMKKEFDCESVVWRYFFNKVKSYNPDELDIIYEQMEILKTKNKATFQAPTCYEDVVNTFTDAYKIPSSICVYPFSMLAVLPNGDATFCVDFPDYIVGNIYNTQLKEIFESDKSERMRRYLKANGGLPICGRCPHRFDKDEFLIQPSI